MEFEQIEIKQGRGPTLEFEGKLLAEIEWQTERPMPLTLSAEIWETKGGALIGVKESKRQDGQGFIDTDACVIEPSDNKEAMQNAILDHFNWDHRAQSLARQLGWSMKWRVA